MGFQWRGWGGELEYRANFLVFVNATNNTGAQSIVVSKRVSNRDDGVTDCNN